MKPTRREFLVAGAAAAVSLNSGRSLAQGQEPSSNLDQRPMRIGMTDWNLGERGITEKIISSVIKSSIRILRIA